MGIKTRNIRADVELDNFIKEIARERRRMTGDKITEVRVTSALPRVRGLREALLSAEWINEGNGRRKKK